jgi:chromate transporter
MMHDETVKRRKWLSDQEFLDLVGATNLIPGPNSTEMAITSAIYALGGLVWSLPGCAYCRAMLIALAGLGIRALVHAKLGGCCMVSSR